MMPPCGLPAMPGFAAMLPAYAELHCRSNFSFLSAASHPEELVARAAQLGYSALAITDECSLAGVVRAHGEAKRRQLHLVVGAEMQLTLAQAAAGAGAAHARLVLLAQTRRGYGNLSEWITVARRRAPKGQYLAHPSDLEGRVPNAPTLAGLPGCFALLLPRAGQPFEEVFAHAMWLKTWFQEGRCAITVELLHHAGDDELVDTAQQVAQASGLPLVAAGGVRMHVRSRKPLHDALAATRLALPVAQCGFALEPNAEAHLRSRGRLQALYPPEWLARTVAIAGQCSFSLDELRYEYPREIVPEGHTPASHLRALTEAGAQRRYRGGVPDAVRALIEHELALIAQLQYEPYFLTVADIVQWARAQGILCQGRGSAANSAVCYCLHVTEVDPSRMNVLFERFISAERNEPPDIDVDFEHDRREEVIQYIYRKYGRDRAALAATVIRYRPRSALRDVGRVLGFDLGQLDQLSRRLAWWDGRQVAPERILEAGLDPASPRVQLLLDLANQLVGFPRHLSQHVGGFVISRGPLAELVPVENAAMADRTVIQWDKDDLEALGLLKVDVLALGMLSAIRRSLQLIGQWLGRPVAMQDIPREVPAVYTMLCEADAMGVFQVESRAQMSMLPRLRPRCYYDLVVEVAIVRPGPIQGGMVHPYLAAREKIARLEPIDYPRPEIKPVLERTHGVPIFQEQVMQLAMVAAGFTAGEADQLRRAMGAWGRKGDLLSYQDKLTAGMLARGYSRDFADALCRQIQGFGSYGFPESHAASFALLVYVSAWIKRFHPAAFLCGLLNSQPMGFYGPSQLIQDARRHGVEVRAVDVLASDWECTLEPSATDAAQPAARLGLRLVKGFGPDAANRIAAARTAGPFASVDELARRARLATAELRTLASAGALASLAGHRRQAWWAAAGSQAAPGMLHEAPIADTPPALPAPAETHDIVADYARLDFSLGRHPLSFLRGMLSAERFLSAAEIADCPDRKLARCAGIVTCRQRPGTAKGTMFVTLEDETGWVNVIVRPELLEAERRILLGASLIGIYGQIARQGSVVHLHAKRVVDRSAMLGRLTTRSRDFH